MTLSTGTNLGLLQHGVAGESHYDELMRFFRGVDLLVQAHVISATTTAPPASPTDGDAYVIPTGASGVWAAHVGELARWTTKLGTAAWEYLTPKKNWRVAVDDASVAGSVLVYSGAAWVQDKVRPTTPAGAFQTAATIFAGSGVPNDADGANGDFYFRGDGTTGSRLYHKASGSWAAVL